MEPRTPAEDLAFFAARGFGKKIGFGRRPALIVIDMLVAFTNADRVLGANQDAEIERINMLLDAAHAAGVMVVLTKVSYEDDNYRDAGIWALKQGGIVDLRTGSDGVEIDGRLRVAPTDMILQKKYASCFFGTDLVSRLASHGVDTLVITGCTTSGCVRATAVDAIQYGFRPMVVSDCVSDRSFAAHEQSLFDLNAKYADLLSAAEVVSELAKVRSK
ncbi:MAG: N-carbamoylsarcosine amidase [Alphaproteobacteria bacterium]|nr:N-carbamoylsarcosine amidase [Alphaproteobacteria bacterium]